MFLSSNPRERWSFWGSFGVFCFLFFLISESLRATWEEKIKRVFLKYTCIFCIYFFFLNLTKLVFCILPVASNVVHANRKHPLSLHLDCPHVVSRDLQCYFKYSFSKCKLKSCINCFVILFLLVNKTLCEQVLVCWPQVNNSFLYKLNDEFF